MMLSTSDVAGLCSMRTSWSRTDKCIQNLDANLFSSKFRTVYQVCSEILVFRDFSNTGGSYRVLRPGRTPVVVSKDSSIPSWTIVLSPARRHRQKSSVEGHWFRRTGNIAELLTEITDELGRMRSLFGEISMVSFLLLLLISNNSRQVRKSAVYRGIDEALLPTNSTSSRQ